MATPLSLDRRREVEQLLRLAIDRSTDEDVSAFVDTGREGLLALRRAIWPNGNGQWTGSYSQADNIRYVVRSVAERWPAEFLVVFSDTGHDRKDSLVLIGLGRIADPIATRRLIAATSGTSWALRDEAAIGLGGRQSDEVERALVALLGDPDYLVRLHAIESLGSTGGYRALEALGRFPDTEGTRTEGIDAAITTARMRIEARFQGRPDVLSVE